MKKTRFLLFILTIVSVLLSACGAATATPSNVGGSAKVEAIPVAFIGMIDSMAGDQWVINGTTVTVDQTVVRDGPFNVGDEVKVEGVVNSDGSFTVSRVELPSTVDLSSLPPFGNDNSNSNINDANVNDGNINAANTNTANANDVNTNGDNSNSANSNDANVNDDNSNSANSNDDNGNSANSNDDNGNDDNGGGSNSNDNGGNDDNSGGNSGSGGGGDDHGGGGNGGGGGDDSGGGSNDD